MKISLIIAYYKNLNALDLILNALQRQTFTEFEVIVAEDDNDAASFTFIADAQKKMPFPLKHLHQEVDNGFRKNEMLNKGIINAEGEIIVFLDGDCIPHKSFLATDAKSMKEHHALFGRRVMLSESLTNRLYSSKNFKFLKLYDLLASKSKRIKYSFHLPFITSYRDIGIWGCNWGVLKKHLIEINGYDQDYIKAGVGEDLDIEWRLKEIGIKLFSVRYGAIVYHLNHKENYSKDDINFNLALFETKKQAGAVFCHNGLTANQ